MRLLIFSLTFVVFISGIVMGQQVPTEWKTETQRVQQERDIQRQQIQRDIVQSRRDEMSRPRSTSIPADTRNPISTKRPVFIKEPSLSPEDLAKIQPDQEDYAKYASILQMENTQLVKILVEPKCGNYLIVDVKDEKCSQAFPLKGYGSFYSFRTGSHADSVFADIRYVEGDFEVGFKNELLGILVELGDVPVESLELKNKDVSALRNFKVPNKIALVEKQKEELSKGFTKSNKNYSNKFSVKSDTTYLIRTVAYQYQEQAINDKRIDAVLAFRVVRKDEKSVTILWRGLTWKDAPKLKMN